MRYPPELLDEIRTRLTLSTVVGRKVRLKKAGREWKGLSPFQAEKTPSFYVNDQKAFYHDFSSGKHGDVFTFLMETEGLPFPEAVERLAAEAGVALPEASPALEQQTERRRDLYDVLEAAALFYEAQLAKAAGAEARAYLDRRGILPGTRVEFRFGFAPDIRNAVIEHLASAGFERDLVVRAGLAIVPEDGRPAYDRFRGRVMIPIQDGKGRVVAFGGRALKADQQPKYLNSPETELFRKGEMVFNAHRARPAAHKAGTVAIVEGYLDAIAVHQAGLPHVVATLGTAFTEGQIAALWRFAPEPVICFDGDRAGRAAAFRAVDRILPELKTGQAFRFAFLPAGQDPDDLVREAGIEALRRLIEGASSIWDVVWTRELEAAHLESENGQAMFERRIRDLVATIPDQTLRRHYEDTARQTLRDHLWRHKRALIKGARPAAGPRVALPNLFSAEPTRLIGLERVFLGLCVQYPDLLELHHERIAGMTFRGAFREESFGDFAGDLLRVVGEYEVAEPQGFYNWMREPFFPTLNHLHGRAREQDGRTLGWGHNLFARLPVLQTAVPERFVEDCFGNFLELLWLRDLEDELKHGTETMPPDADDGYALWLMSLQRDLLEMRERVLRRELELAEEATAYRPSTGRDLGVAANPLGMIADESGSGPDGGGRPS